MIQQRKFEEVEHITITYNKVGIRSTFVKLGVILMMNFFRKGHSNSVISESSYSMLEIDDLQSLNVYNLFGQALLQTAIILKCITMSISHIVISLEK